MQRVARACVEQSTPPVALAVLNDDTYAVSVCSTHQNLILCNSFVTA